MDNQTFNIKTIDKGKIEQFRFEFRLIEERIARLQKLQVELDNRQQDWYGNMQMLWGDINRLKEELK